MAHRYVHSFLLSCHRVIVALPTYWRDLLFVGIKVQHTSALKEFLVTVNLLLCRFVMTFVPVEASCQLGHRGCVTVGHPVVQCVWCFSLQV